MRSKESMSQRFLSDDELRDARALIGRLFWAPPILFTVSYFVAAWFAFRVGVLAEVICFVLLGGLGIWSWLSRSREYKKFARDIDARIVEVAEGAPESVWMTQDGRCYVRVAGRSIRVPNDCYKELHDANAVKIEYLPESCIATRVKIVHGIGIAG
jgi:hypothetical protein